MIIEQIPSFAKINLYLRIISRYKDGYHKIITLFQSIDFYDLIDLEIRTFLIPATAIEATGYEVPLDQSNTILKAVTLFRKYSNKSFSIGIRLNKAIPPGSGLGGGSSNAAVTLYALNSLLGKPFNTDELISIAREIGADVPYFLQGGAAVGSQRGDRIKSHADMNIPYILLVLPEMSILTPEVYRKYDELLTENDINNNILSFKKSVALDELINSARNDLEKIVLRDYPQIKKIKKMLKENGAKMALLSGSGSSVFGLFDNPDKLKKAHEAAVKLKWRCIITRAIAGEEYWSRINNRIEMQMAQR